MHREEHDERSVEDRDEYQTPEFDRHGTLEELTAAQAKGTQTGSDQQSVPS